MTDCGIPEDAPPMRMARTPPTNEVIAAPRPFELELHRRLRDLEQWLLEEQHKPDDSNRQSQFGKRGAIANAKPVGQRLSYSELAPQASLDVKDSEYGFHMGVGIDGIASLDARRYSLRNAAKAKEDTSTHSSPQRRWTHSALQTQSLPVQPLKRPLTQPLGAAPTQQPLESAVDNSLPHCIEEDSPPSPRGEPADLDLTSDPGASTGLPKKAKTFPGKKDAKFTHLSSSQRMMLPSSYKMFELCPAWTKEYDSYADRVAERMQTTGFTKMNTKHSKYVGEALAHCVIKPTSSTFVVWNLLFLIVLGYGKDGRLVTDRQLIAYRYLSTWFCADCLILLVDVCLMFGNIFHSFKALAFLRVGKALRYLRVARLLRITRMRKLVEAIYIFDELINSQTFTIAKSILLNVLGVLVICHYLACFWYYLGMESVSCWVGAYKMESDSVATLYLTSLHWALTQVTPGSSSVQPQSISEKCFAVGVLVFGLIIFSSIVSSITAAANSLKSVNRAYATQRATMRRFFRQEAMDPELVARVTRYADHMLQQRIQSLTIEAVPIFRMLPQSLFLEVVDAQFAHFLRVHPFFKAVSVQNPQMVRKLCHTALAKTGLVAEDIIFQPGESCQHMYFVSRGDFTYTMLGCEAAPLTQSWFCEAVLWVRWVHQGTMVADDDSELLLLSSDAFQDVFSYHHADLWLAKLYATEFVRGMNELAGFFTETEDDDQDLPDTLVVDTAYDLLPSRGRRVSASNYKNHFVAKPAATTLSDKSFKWF
eukprot:TRINITY_DN10408_c0_g1_i2.p1 TRINITY_DN10408_c0_g1~~TRINITY_DN10408_c0_g1_i2.p1  ORF type:complete len:765 (-),score=135.18 TRINITY_DN10408_c0_g1_i2:73-2367(-)